MDLKDIMAARRKVGNIVAYLRAQDEVSARADTPDIISAYAAQVSPITQQAYDIEEFLRQVETAYKFATAPTETVIYLNASYTSGG